MPAIQDNILIFPVPSIIDCQVTLERCYMHALHMLGLAVDPAFQAYVEGVFEPGTCKPGPVKRVQRMKANLERQEEHDAQEEQTRMLAYNSTITSTARPQARTQAQADSSTDTVCVGAEPKCTSGSTTTKAATTTGVVVAESSTRVAEPSASTHVAETYAGSSAAPGPKAAANTDVVRCAVIFKNAVSLRAAVGTLLRTCTPVSYYSSGDDASQLCLVRVKNGWADPDPLADPDPDRALHPDSDLSLGPVSGLGPGPDQEPDHGRHQQDLATHPEVARMQRYPSESREGGGTEHTHIIVGEDLARPERLADLQHALAHSLQAVLDFRDTNGYSLLAWAAGGLDGGLSPSCASAKLLVDAGVDAAASGTEDGCTVMHWCAYYGRDGSTQHVDIVRHATFGRGFILFISSRGFFITGICFPGVFLHAHNVQHWNC